MIAAAHDPFAALADKARWCAWRPEERNGRFSKIPYNAHGADQTNRPERGCANDPKTWATRAQAERMAARIVNGHGGGVMLALGDLGDAKALAGIDLDACLGGGALAPWAAAVLAAVPSYAEISPSGRGLKIFFRIETAAVRPFLDKIGVDGAAWGCRRVPAGERGADHGPAVEVYFGGRFFVATGRHWPGSPSEIATLDGAALAALAGVIPAKETAEPRERGGEATGDGAKVGRDNSRSGAAFRLGAKMHAEDKSFGEFCRAVAADPATAAWYREKGKANDMRELRRIWDRTAPDAANVPGDAPPFSDEALALEFAEKYAPDLRYVAAWGRWFEWDGTRWKPDSTLRAYDLARATCRAAAARCNKGKTKRAVASAATVAAVERLARADRRLAAATDQWDRDPWILNTPGGVVDLRTGELRPSERAEHLTKTTAVAPGGDCPQWLAFLNRIFAGDAELISFMQRWCGYCLTGVTTEQALMFCYGTGSNGKSKFIEAISGILGDYSTLAAMETFTASNSERHPTDMAGLRGARLVTATETEEGRRWAESRIKALTGGDAISARFMRQDFFTYVPQFKLTFAGNHRPGLRGVDEAIRRRMILVPFAVTIPKSERDDKLGEKLKEEWPGILRWMIEGCVAWQRQGLGRPAVVVAATSEYLAAEDAVAAWIGERCRTGANDVALSSDLFASWKAWADDAGEFAGSQRRFSQKLADRGFERVKDGKGRMIFRGIKLLPLLGLAT